MKHFWITFLIFTKIHFFLYSQNDTLAIFDYSLEQLMTANVYKQDTLDIELTNTKPYTVLTINKKQIENSGATDLLELLRNIAGIEFGTDVIGQLGIFVNGIWANEGKILLLIDGHQMNENLYGTLQFGKHYPLENIKEIRIIKGSGSIWYGQFAELMIIDIITKDYDDNSEISSNFNLTPNQAPFTRSMNIGTGIKLKQNKIKISAFGHYLDSYRSDQYYTDFFDSSYSMLENKINDIFLNVNISGKNLKFSMLYDKYSTTSRDYFTHILSYPYPKDFTTFSTYITYQYSFKNFALFYKANYKYDIPWESYLPRQNPADSTYYTHKQTIRTVFNQLNWSYKLGNYIFLRGGASINSQLAKKISSVNNVYWNGERQVLLNTFSIYGESFYSKDFFTLISGLRYEYNTIYGYSIMPKLVLNLKFPVLNFKYIYTKSYRAPTIANFDYNIPLVIQTQYALIRPEIFNVFSTEIKAQINPFLDITLLASYKYTDNGITYFVDENGTEGYANIGQLGTFSMENMFNFHRENLILSVNTAVYRSVIKDKLDFYSASKYPQSYLGVPNFKLTLSLSRAHHNFIPTLKLIALGKRIGYCCLDTASNTPQLKEFPPSIIINPNLTVKGKKFSVNFYIHNAFNTKDYFIQAYNGWHAPIPNTGLTLGVKMKYKFNY